MVSDGVGLQGPVGVGMLRDGDGDADALRLGMTVTLKLGLVVADVERDGDGDSDGERDVVTDCDYDRQTVGVTVPFNTAVVVARIDTLTEPDDEPHAVMKSADCVEKIDGDGLTDKLVENRTVRDGELLLHAGRLRLRHFKIL